MKTLLLSAIALASTTAYTSPTKAEVVELNLWEQDSPEVGIEMDKWIKVYMKKHPNVKIVRQHYENEALRTKYLRSSVTGDGADIVYGPNDLAGVFATAKVIQPVDTLVKDLGLEATSVAVTKLSGQTWGVPISVGNHLMLYYNKKLVSKAPNTFNELVTESKSFMKKKKGGFGLAMYQSEPFWFAPLMGAFGAWPLDYKNGDVSVSLDTKEAKKALTFLTELKDKEKILPKDCDYECAKTMFLSEKAPFHISGDWEVNTLKEKFGKQLGIAPLPKVDATGKYATPLLGGRYVFINASLKDAKLKAAKDFIRFMTSNAVQLRVATQLHRIPSSAKVRQSAQVKKDSILDALITATKHAKPSPSDVEMRAAWDGLRIMVQRAMSGKESVDVAAKTGQKAAEEALSALKKSPSGKSH